MGLFTADRVVLGEHEMRIYSDELVDLLRRAKNMIDSGMRARKLRRHIISAET